jgi:hypothetical protein
MWIQTEAEAEPEAEPEPEAEAEAEPEPEAEAEPEPEPEAEPVVAAGSRRRIPIDDSEYTNAPAAVQASTTLAPTIITARAAAATSATTTLAPVTLAPVTLAPRSEMTAIVPSAQIAAGIKIAAVLVSATSTYPNYPHIFIYDAYVSEETARSYWDLTLGGGCSTYGFIAKFRDNADPALIYAGSLISSTANRITTDNQAMFFNQLWSRGGSATKVFEWIRWGYTANVRPNKIFWAGGSYATEDQRGGTCELWGYTSNDFVTGATLLWSGAFPNVDVSYGFTGGGGNTAGWSHYQVKNTTPAGGSWAMAGSILLQL